MAFNQQAYGHDLASKQAEIDFKEEQGRSVAQKLGKSELAQMALQQKQAETELMLSQVRRLHQSTADDKKAVEAKLELALKERDRHIALAQNLQNESLEMQLTVQKL
mmetsp:Transcript_10209/g.13841  ORF Transcript_10209/g.13841 Transcript_10209/m.13841 type:complete len:107 (-) Transcript_10209:55-375(-)